MSEADLIFYISVGSFIVTFIYYLTVWFFFGKDEKIGTIVPTYKMPKDLSLGVIEALKNDGMFCSYDKAFEYSIASLIANGFIKVEGFDDKEISLSKTDKNEDDIIFKEEKVLYDEMFKESDALTIKNKAPENEKEVQLRFVNSYKKYVKKLQEIKNEIVISNALYCIGGILIHGLWMLVLVNHFVYDVNLLTDFYKFYYFLFFMSVAIICGFIYYDTGKFIHSFMMIVSLILVYLPIKTLKHIKMFSFFDNPIIIKYVIFMSLIIILHLIFMFLMKKPKKEAIKIINQIQGFKMFIETVEKERFKEITQQIYKENLPYAYFFGLSKKWKEKCEDVSDINSQGVILYEVLGTNILKNIIDNALESPKSDYR